MKLIWKIEKSYSEGLILQEAAVPGDAALPKRIGSTSKKSERRGLPNQ